MAAASKNEYPSAAAIRKLTEPVQFYVANKFSAGNTWNLSFRDYEGIGDNARSWGD